MALKDLDALVISERKPASSYPKILHCGVCGNNKVIGQRFSGNLGWLDVCKYCAKAEWDLEDDKKYRKFKRKYFRRLN